MDFDLAADIGEIIADIRNTMEEARKQLEGEKLADFLKQCERVIEEIQTKSYE